MEIPMIVYSANCNRNTTISLISSDGCTCGLLTIFVKTYHRSRAQFLVVASPLSIGNQPDPKQIGPVTCSRRAASL